MMDKLFKIKSKQVHLLPSDLYGALWFIKHFPKYINVSYLNPTTNQ